MNPITEEDKPAVESMILRLKRLRKREDSHGSRYTGEYLGNAIKELMEYGAIKGWWEYD